MSGKLCLAASFHVLPSSLHDLGGQETKVAGYTDRQRVAISLAIAVTVFTNVFHRIDDTAVD